MRLLRTAGQATCRRTMEVVEELNNTYHLEKIHYFMWVLSHLYQPGAHRHCKLFMGCQCAFAPGPLVDYAI
jgi:hypothetical protein